MFASPYYWWVQSVMPVVFDNSLSYYEVLAKLTQYVEGLIGDVDKIEKIIGTIEGIEDVTEFMQFLQVIQNEIGNLSNLNTDNKSDLVSAINEIVQDANNKIGNLNNLPTRNKDNLVDALSEVYTRAQNGYILPVGGIPESDLSQDVQNKLNDSSGGSGGGGTVNVDYKINNVTLKKSPNNNTLAELGIGTYTVPEGGIPESTLSDAVRAKLNSGGGGGGTYDYTALDNKPQINGHTLNAGNNSASELGLGTYSLPDGGIPESQLSNAVAVKLNRAYIMPNGGIPESDLSDAVKEKLNTSGGIADENNGFVARRNYNAGELVYINGVLYRVTNKTLAGSNFVVGNNIVETDINEELADINDKIDKMASGQGLDSWSLFADVRPEGASTEVNFFEYINCIGSEDYLFIVKRFEYSSSYAISIKKRDGTLVASITDPSTSSGGHQEVRYTFTPEETGDYYCTIKGDHYTNTRPYVRVELEYTQSQGITELWEQVNEATTLEPRVAAVEGLVEQQQTQLSNLDGVPQRVTSLESEMSKVKNDLGNKLNITNGAFDGGAWGERFYSLAIPVKPGYIVKLTTGTRSSSYGVLKTFAPDVGDSPDFSSASGFTSFKTVSANTTTDDLVMPNDAGALYLYAGANTSYDRLPINIVINGVDIQGDAFSQIRDIVETFSDENNELDARIENLEDTLENYDNDIALPKLQPYGIEPQSLSLFKKSVNLFSDFCYHITDSYYSSLVVPPGPIRVSNAPGWQGWLIAVKPNTTYTCGPLDFRLYFFGKDYIFTERKQDVNDAGNNTFTTGNKTVWVALTQRTSHDMSAWMLVEGDTYPEEYVSGYPQWVAEPLAPSEPTHKTIAFMGDSITAGVGARKLYHEYLHDRYGWTCLNYGFGGSGFARNSMSNSSGRIGLGVPGRGVPTTPDNYFTPNNINARLTELDPTVIDGIVIFAGTNDYGNDISIADYTDAIDDAFSYCQTNFPTKPVLVMTPVHRKTGVEPNDTGKNLRDYVNILIEECEKYGIAYVDTMTMSGLNPANDENLAEYFRYDDSGLHPDQYGHMRIASVVGEMLKQVISYTDFIYDGED